MEDFRPKVRQSVRAKAVPPKGPKTFHRPSSRSLLAEHAHETSISTVAWVNLKIWAILSRFSVYTAKDSCEQHIPTLQLSDSRWWLWDPHPLKRLWCRHQIGAFILNFATLAYSCSLQKSLLIDRGRILACTFRMPFRLLIDVLDLSRVDALLVKTKSSAVKSKMERTMVPVSDWIVSATEG